MLQCTERCESAEEIERMPMEALHVDEIESDVECLMCARVIGRLFGHRWRTAAGGSTGRTIANLTTYWDNDPGAQPRAVQACERFRCRACGGQGYVGEIMSRTLIEHLASIPCPIHTVPRRGPGRPPTGCLCEPPRLAA